jgi:hypothetical protein
MAKINNIDVSIDTLETIKHMVEFCVNRGFCMGQDEGFLTFEDNPKNNKKSTERLELEKFCK